MSDEPQWFGEPPISGYRQEYEIRSLLHREESGIQTIEVFDSLSLGRMLVLNHAVQVAERDEFIYHEMLAHVALITHPNPRRVLIIGGGDAGLLRRALQHGLEQAVLVEIDRRVVEVCHAFLPAVAENCLASPNAKLIIGDGVDYVSTHSGSCDVLLVDSTDPVGPAQALFSPNFLTAAYDCLTDDGIFVTQSGSPLLMASELIDTNRHLRQIFPIVRTYLAFIPSYPGMVWSFTLGSKKHDPADLDVRQVVERLHDRGINTRYYTPELHRACFALPKFLIEMIAEGKEPDLFAGKRSVSCQ